MHSIPGTFDQPLDWIQSSPGKRKYELFAGTKSVAALGWQQGAVAVAHTACGDWSFDQVGFWRRRVTIRPRGRTTDAAAFDPGLTGGGTLALLGGDRFTWGADNIRRSRWGWRTAEGVRLASMERCRRGPAGVVGHVAIELAAVTLPDFDLLALLGWYLLLLQARDRDDGVIAAIVGAAAAS